MTDKRHGDNEEIFSKRIKAGRRVYYFDVKATKNNDYYVTITESTRNRFDESTSTKHKIFLYKEDFNKFTEALNEAIGHVKSNLLPEYGFDEYPRKESEEEQNSDSEG